jgi:hypothetical protein
MSELRNGLPQMQELCHVLRTSPSMQPYNNISVHYSNSAVTEISHSLSQGYLVAIFSDPKLYIRHLLRNRVRNTSVNFIEEYEGEQAQK